MTILYIIIFTILFSVWIAGAYDTCDYIDTYYSFSNIHFVFKTLLVLAIVFFWPVFKLYFFIKSLRERIGK